MQPPSDLFSWDFWAKDSLGLYHLFLIVGGTITVLLLAVRTFAVNLSAQAALNQARTAADRHEEQTNADRARRITESFAKAGEQLSSDRLETRLSAIYSFERIARESEGDECRQYGPVVETLTAYVRGHAPWPPSEINNPTFTVQDIAAYEAEKAHAPERLNNEDERASEGWRPATDIQAILTVLGRRDESARKQQERVKLDLTSVDLRGANLRGAHLEGANLRGAHLEGADLREAHLQGADLREAHLQGANLWFAQMEDANLMEAHLQGAYLAGVRFKSVKLMRVRLENANLMGAFLEGSYLRTAIGVTQEQLNAASGDEETVPPEGLTWPTHWPASAAAGLISRSNQRPKNERAR